MQPSVSLPILFHVQAFAKTFNSSPDDLDMQVIYDVSHNIAKVEEHVRCRLRARAVGRARRP